MPDPMGTEAVREFILAANEEELRAVLGNTKFDDLRRSALRARDRAFLLAAGQHDLAGADGRQCLNWLGDQVLHGDEPSRSLARGVLDYVVRLVTALREATTPPPEPSLDDPLPPEIERARESYFCAAAARPHQPEQIERTENELRRAILRALIQKVIARALTT